MTHARPSPDSLGGKQQRRARKAARRHADAMHALSDSFGFWNLCCARCRRARACCRDAPDPCVRDPAKLTIEQFIWRDRMTIARHMGLDDTRAYNAARAAIAQYRQRRTQRSTLSAR
jgi:hypothetical protein